MINIQLLIFGTLIGLVMSVPVGPVNVMCFQRSMHKGFISGAFAGLGAVIIDVFFASIAAFSIHGFASFLSQHARAFQFCGGAILIAYGIWYWRRRHHPIDKTEEGPAGLLSGTLSASLATLTNPGAVLGYATVFSLFAQIIAPPQDYFGAVLLVAGVAIGSTIWWITLSLIVATFRDRFSDHWTARINVVAGASLLFAGVYVLTRSLV